MRLANSHTLFAETAELGRFPIEFTVTVEEYEQRFPCPKEVIFKAKLESRHSSHIDPVEQPSFRAWYIDERSEIHVEDVRKGCLLPHQNFSALVFLDFRRLVPTAKTIYLANVLERHTENLIKKCLSGELHNPMDKVVDSGPLIKALLRAGFHNIHGVREGSSAYIGLRAQVPNNAL